MYGVPVSESTKVLCDNESVVKNCTLLESTLVKKHNAIAYHTVRWTVAAGVISVAWIDGKNNLADAMTKRLPETTRERLFNQWIY